jgi:hypothetical protein
MGAMDGIQLEKSSGDSPSGFWPVHGPIMQLTVSIQT